MNRSAAPHAVHTTANSTIGNAAPPVTASESLSTDDEGDELEPFATSVPATATGTVDVLLVVELVVVVVAALPAVTSSGDDTVTVAPDAALPVNVIVCEPAAIDAGTTKIPEIAPELFAVS